MNEDSVFLIIIINFAAFIMFFYIIKGNGNHVLSVSRETSFSLFEKFTLKVSVMHDSFKIGLPFPNALPVAALQGCFLLS